MYSDALFLECFGNFGDKFEQRQAGIDETLALARFLGEGGNIVAGEVEQTLKTLEVSSHYARTFGRW
jgi:hypothetical protein